jgi:hypothetical protein
MVFRMITGRSESNGIPEPRSRTGKCTASELTFALAAKSHQTRKEEAPASEGGRYKSKNSGGEERG